MGFDLTGLDPTINEEHSQEYNDILKLYGKDGWLDWSMDIPEATKDRYFELKDQFQEDNPGNYFRNNVWWWRPLWQFVCESCNDFLTEKDMGKGDSNSGYKISKTKSVKIAKRLFEEISDGYVDEVEREHTLRAAKAQSDNEQLQEQMDAIHKEVNKNRVGDSIVPANYPKPYYKKWKKLQDAHNWDGDYPFDKQNVENFAKFCLESGGFEIC